jgi:hypothetical protein
MITTVGRWEPGIEVDEAQLAAASFLARYSGRTVEAYRHDLRGFFLWAADLGLAVLEATRPHVELSYDSTPTSRTCSSAEPRKKVSQSPK